MRQVWDIAIVGGGASGLAAAIEAGREAKQIGKELSILLLEKKEIPGKKLSVTGNGRCNLSNAACGHQQTVTDFFRAAGIAVREEEDGRRYPYNEDAQEVAAVLTEQARRLGVRIMTSCEIQSVEAMQTGGFHLFTMEDNIAEEDRAATRRSTKKAHDARKKITEESLDDAAQRLTAKTVLIATGGKSYGVFGSTGDGYRFARALGHEVITPVPALTAIDTAEDLTVLKGIRAKAQVSLLRDDRICAQEAGEVQFRADGLSGICILNLSGRIRLDKTSGRSIRALFADYRLVLNLVPDFTRTELLEFFQSHFALCDCCAADLLRTLVKAPLAEYLLRRAGIRPEMSAAILSASQLGVLADGLQHFSLTICGTKGWNEAQVTAGGVRESQVNELTMESCLVPGLYFAGEVLEYAGPCGGYNLHHAWLTGIRAGRAMAAMLLLRT